MRVTGHVMIDPMGETVFDLSEAVLTDERFAVDWDNGDTKVCIVTTSGDRGITYVGKCGSPELEPGSKVRLVRYRSKGSTIEYLVGTLVSTLTEEEFEMMFKVETKKTAQKPKAQG